MNSINIIAISFCLIIYIIGLMASIILVKRKNAREVYKKIIKSRIEVDNTLIAYLKNLSIRILFGVVILFVLLLFNLQK